MKKLLSVLIISFYIFAFAGCELVKKVPTDGSKLDESGNVVNENSAAEVLNPSDHIFDIDLNRLKEDLNGSKFGEKEDWAIKGEEIQNSEFGGSSLANNKMESTYFLTVAKLNSNDKNEIGVSVSYDWDKNHWVFTGYRQIYILPLAEGETTIDRTLRQEKIMEFQNKPQVPELKPEVVEEEVVNEGVGGEEIVAEDEEIVDTEEEGVVGDSIAEEDENITE